jgi:hypothetical protein
MQRFVIYTFCSLLAGSWMSLPAATGIGMVNASGTFTVDHSRVVGNATLFDGTVVETGRAAGDLQLNTGARMQLASESRGRVFQDRLVLERGVGQLQGTGYRIEARSLRIVTDEPVAAARVALSGTHVQVAALQGRLHVTNAQGLLVANMAPGTALEFEPQGESADTTSKLTGILRRKAGKFLLTDDTTKVTAELRGAGLASKVGKLVEITGQIQVNATAAAGATQVIAVQTIALAQAGVAAGAAAGAASAAGAAATGVSAGTVAVIGGVAAAGTVAGLGVTGSLPGQGDSSQQNSSR